MLPKHKLNSTKGDNPALNTESQSDLQKLAATRKRSIADQESSYDEIDRIHALDLMGLPYIPPTKDNAGMSLRTTNPVVFFEVAAFGGQTLRNGQKSMPSILGKLFIELRRDLLPVAAANFLSLCEGTIGVGEDGVRYHYKGTKIHRIIKDCLFQGGDLLDQDGECSKSIYNRGGVFRDENYILRHTGPGCLSYCNRGCDSNGSLFQMTLRENPDLDGRFVVFGCIVNEESMETLFKIGNLGTITGKPLEEVRIIDCGIAFGGNL